MKLSAVSAEMPRQFVNDRTNDATVGSQMKEMHRKVGIPTIRAIMILSRRVSSE